MTALFATATHKTRNWPVLMTIVIVLLVLALAAALIYIGLVGGQSHHVTTSSYKVIAPGTVETTSHPTQPQQTSSALVLLAGLATALGAFLTGLAKVISALKGRQAAA